MPCFSYVKALFRNWDQDFAVPSDIRGRVMIVFDLVCSNSHTFEAWFPDSRAFERQRRKKAVACPRCGDAKVQKALMAPNIATSKKRVAADKRASDLAAEAMRMLAEARRQVEDNCDYVGDKFAEEARKIHYGETEKKRAIYGQATKPEAEELRDEGIEFNEIPWVPRLDS